MNIEAIDKRIRSFAENTPDKVAIECGNEKVTYRQLDKNSNRIANFLIGNYKERKNVFIIMERDQVLIETLIGVIKSGGVFIPIDHQAPDNRILTALKEIEADWIITTPDLLEKVNSIIKETDMKFNILMMKNKDSLGFKNNSSLNIFVIEDDFKSSEKIYEYSNNKHCYIYFTSGSCGKPKGVLGRHRSLMQFIQWEIKEMDLNNTCRISQLTPVAFDPFLRDVFVPLCAGGTLCIPHNLGIILNPIKLINWIEEKGITLIHIVPSLFKMMASTIDDVEKLKSLKYVLLAGEILRGNDIKTFMELFGRKTQLVNLYGPTETTLAKLFYKIDKDDANRSIIPVGKPIDFAEAFILNEDLQRCAKGIVGEIYIRTPFISSGYCNNKALTREVFLRNPFSNNPNDIIYKTGDFGRRLSDGNIEVLGREDNQVKIRGIRIELGEIENKLLEHKFINEAIVIAKEDKTNDKYLCAYIVSNIKINDSELKSHLSDYLPDYMIPSHFIQLEEMPLNQNGKIDRKEIASMNEVRGQKTEYIGPRNIIEEKLWDIWSDLLKTQKINIDCKFFDIGGHSLKAAKLIAEIYREFNVEISFEEVFENPTIRQLGEHIEKSKESIYSSIMPVEEEEVYEVSSAQRRLFALNQFSKEEKNYNSPYIMLVEGKLDRNRAEQAFKKLVERHEVFRTSFELRNEEIVQRVHKEIKFNVEYMEIKDHDKKVIKEIIESFISPFDLAEAPLLRVKLVKLEEEKHILMVDMHHIISDGSSKGIILKEFGQLYKGEELQALRIQYKDYAAWQNEFLNSEAMRRQEKYWMEVFSGEIPVLNMPTDYPRPTLQSFEGENIGFKIDKELLEKIKKIGSDSGATLYMTLLSIYNILLSQYSGQEDIIVGSPIAGRPHSDLKDLVGMFVNTLAMRNYPRNEMTFKDFLREVKRNALNAYENQSYQFDELVEKLDIRRDISRNTLFDTMFILQNTEIEELNINNLKLKLYGFEHKISKFDITLSAAEVEEELVFNIEYCTRLFKRETIERIKHHFLNILREVVENPEIKLSEIQMLSEEEKKKIFVDFNDTKKEYPSNKTIHELFEEQVERTPNNIAVTYEDQRLTYMELNARINSLAKVLRNKGVKRDVVVGIMLEKSVHMIISIMAVLKAGGATLPIDPEYPQSRIEYILQDSNAMKLLINDDICIKEDLDFKGEIININKEGLLKEDNTNLENISTPDDLIYVIYTSGTTGNPKGVMLEHKNIVNLISYQYQCTDIKFNGRVPQFAVMSFDVCYQEIFSVLLSGGEIYIISKDIRKDANAFLNLVKEKETETFILPTAYLKFISNHDEYFDKLSKRVKNIITAGEQLIISDNLKRCLKEKEIYLHNHYGPSETHVVTTLTIDYSGEISSVPTIGKPISNTKIHILDKNNRLQPIGVIGELFIAGDSVGRGYINSPKLTKEKFVENPFISEERMYRTGDLARWLPNGNIEFLGRIDHQVKIRGYRVEPGEIESQLLKHKDIKEAAVIARGDKQENKYLCAYFVSHREMTSIELREYLSKELPDYMIPSYLIQLAKMPMTTNGKLDRRLLPEPHGEINTGVEYIAPENEVQEKLVKIWSEVLRVQKIGIDDDFFALGGHSLKAIRVLSIIHRELNVEVPVSEVFSKPTIRQIAKYIEKSNKSLYSPIEAVEESEVYKASSAQRRMFLLNQFNEAGTNYNIPYITKVGGNLEKEKVEKIFNRLIEKHESFRTSFELQDEEIVQRIHKEVDFKVEYEDMSGVEEEVIKGIAKSFIRPFDLSKAPLLRVKIVKLEAEKHMLMVDMHHIISDGTSMGILIKEFARMYKGEDSEWQR